MRAMMVGSTIDAHAHTVQRATTRLADARDALARARRDVKVAWPA